MRLALPLLVLALLPGTAAAAPVIERVTALAPTAGKPVRIVVETSREANGVRVDRAAGGAFAASACAIRPDGALTRPGGRFEIPVAGAGDVLVSVTATGCAEGAPPPETTSQGYALEIPDLGELLPPLPALPALPAIPGVPLARAAAGCRDARLRVRGRTRRRVRRAILCLVNAQRRAAGLPRLRIDRRLERAAAAHARDMRRRRFFAHEGPGGPDLATRLKRARFWPATAGENLAVATASLATATTIVDAWTNSTGHRANMLDRRFTRLGIGLEPAFPAPPSTPGATVAAAFGSRG